MLVLGIDLGTTACKVCAFNLNEELVYQCRYEYAIISNKPGDAEISPTEIKNAVFSGIKETSQNIKEPITAISFSSQGEGVIALDKSLKPLSNIIVSYDNRSEEYADIIEKQFGKRNIFNKTGQIISSACTATKIMWLLNNIKNEKEIYKFCCVGDFIISCFDIEPLIDYSLAARTMMLDVKNMLWDREIIEYIGIEQSMLSKLVQAGTIAGYIDEKLGKELGLTQKVAIVVGGHDQACGLYGASLEGESYYSIGTTETCVCEFDRFVPELFDCGLPCYPHVLKNKYISLPGNYTGGIVLKWYKDNFLPCSIKERVTYNDIIENMYDKPTKLLALPHFTITGSPYNDSNSCGAIIGLKLSTEQGEISRALIEACTMEIKLNIEILKELGIEFKKMIASGRITNTPKIMQLKADVLNKEIVVKEALEASALGAGKLAFNAIGIKPYTKKDNKERIYKPINENSTYYNKQYSKYKKIYPAIKSIIE